MTGTTGKAGGEIDRDRRLDAVIDDAGAHLRGLQRADGHWLFELEADTTISSEYIMLEHFLGLIDDEIEAKIAAYLRDRQGDHGGWPLFHDGDLDLSATVKAYFALKLAGDDPAADHMRRAREAILARGGAARTNVFTRISLALHGQVPWRAAPTMPIEIMLLPRWSPFHLSKVSYWSRTVIVPLLVLAALKPRAVNPRRVDLAELFVVPPDEVRDYQRAATDTALGRAFVLLDRFVRVVEPRLSETRRRRAIDAALAFVRQRLNGEDGLGAIFPAMANAAMAFHALGLGHDHPDFRAAFDSVRRLLVVRADRAYCQPCLSPVWDTALATHALLEAGGPDDRAAAARGLDWLAARQILEVAGDWAERRPDLRPGGWAFQYRNDHYPDVDDTAVVAMALHRHGEARHRYAIDRAAEWILGMQSSDGGWGAFDVDNAYHYLNAIPFADHGALLDPPTVDVSARCVGMLAQVGYDRDNPAIARGLHFIRREQEADGSWFGRWGTNYVYGTWSALSALNAAGEDMAAPHVGRAVAWLEGRQRPDGGWGEDGATYWPERRDEAKASTPSQTAWALLALMAAGAVDRDSVRRGVDFLLAAPRTGAKWHEDWFTAVGFPRVFYLRYDGYSAYFPLWALARYRTLIRGNRGPVPWGM